MKQRYKRLAALAAAMMMTVSLASCGSKNESVSQDITAKSNNAAGTQNGSRELSDDITGEANYTAEANDGAAKNEAPAMLEAEAAYDTTAGGLDTAAAAAVGGNETAQEKYAPIEENGFKLTSREPLSTFSTDVDTASYANVRRMLNKGNFIYPDAVRAEEFINYFSYSYSQPEGDAPIAVTTELSDCPWNEDAKLLLVGVQAKEIEQETRPDMNLVLLIDVSGSMGSGDKLPLAVTAKVHVRVGILVKKCRQYLDEVVGAFSVAEKTKEEHVAVRIVLLVGSREIYGVVDYDHATFAFRTLHYTYVS